jgi:diketogulonate reductase-like aldo/keto reductase
MYRNEEGVGKALDGRTDVFVTTKLGNSDHGFDRRPIPFIDGHFYHLS